MAADLSSDRDLCRVCSARVPRKKLASLGPIDVLRCSQCGVVSVYPLPAEEELRDGYECFNAGVLARNSFAAYSHQARRMLRTFAPAVSHAVSPKRMFDYGCGGGHFLKAAADLGFDALGMEIDGASVRYGRQRGMEIVHGTLPSAVANLPTDGFDLIVCMHVLEHVPSPWDVVRCLGGLARDDAVILLGVPDQDSIPSSLKIAARKFGLKRSEWGFVQPPIHLHGFSRASLKHVLEKAGIEPIRILRTSPLDRFTFPSADSYWRGRACHRLVYSLAALAGGGGHLLAVCKKAGMKSRS